MYNEGYYKKRNNKIEIISFKTKEDCKKVMELFLHEKKINEVYNQVKKLEKKYNSKGCHDRNQIKSCYTDKYILGVWDIEKYTEEKGEGFNTFEDFLLDFIEQNLIFE